MTWGREQLPTPSRVDSVNDTTAVLWSDGGAQGTALLQRNVPDLTLNTRQFDLVYVAVSGAMLSALRDHGKQFVGSFDWIPPGESTAIRVRHREPVSIDWDNGAWGSARVFLEEVPAH